MPSLMADGEFMVVRLGQFGNEQGRTLETAGVAAGHAKYQVRKIQFVLRARAFDKRPKHGPEQERRRNGPLKQPNRVGRRSNSTPGLHRRDRIGMCVPATVGHLQFSPSCRREPVGP